MARQHSDIKICGMCGIVYAGDIAIKCPKCDSSIRDDFPISPQI